MALSGKEIIIENEISSVLWDFFSRYLYSYICLIMRCSLLKYDVLIIFLAFPFVLNPALTESFR